jgi:hypothetical protein
MLAVFTLLNFGTVNKRFLFKEKEIDICFVSSQFGTSVDDTDLMMSPPIHAPSLYEHAKFFVFTNLPDLKPPMGWDVVLRDYPQYNRTITQSRVPKFQGYLDHVIDWNCQVVFYFDASADILGSLEEFQEEAKRLLEPDSAGLVQPLHPWGGGVRDEVIRIVDLFKDTPENANISLTWFESQPDYSDDIPVYQNTYFGYSVKSRSFQKVASFFWEHYSKEVGMWRDQPLWSYSLSHCNVTPVDFLIAPKKMFAPNPRRQGMNGHTYAEGAPQKPTPSEAEAVKFRQKASEMAIPGRPKPTQASASFRTTAASGGGTAMTAGDTKPNNSNLQRGGNDNTTLAATNMKVGKPSDTHQSSTEPAQSKASSKTSHEKLFDRICLSVNERKKEVVVSTTLQEKCEKYLHEQANKRR